jgi:hypothetical protein
MQRKTCSKFSNDAHAAKMGGFPSDLTPIKNPGLRREEARAVKHRVAGEGEPPAQNKRRLGESFPSAGRSNNLAKRSQLKVKVASEDRWTSGIGALASSWRRKK